MKDETLKQIKPADLITVLRRPGHFPEVQVLTNVYGVLGGAAGAAMDEWQHQNTTKQEGWEAKGAEAAERFRQIAGFDILEVGKAEADKRRELGLDK